MNVVGCQFQDVCHGKRLRQLLGQLSGKVGMTTSWACQDWANTKAAYLQARFEPRKCGFRRRRSQVYWFTSSLVTSFPRRNSAPCSHPSSRDLTLMGARHLQKHQRTAPPISAQSIRSQPLLQDQFDDIAMSLHARPRKSLHWKDPAELFLQEGAFDFVQHWSDKINPVALAP